MRAKGESRRRNNHAAARYAYAVCGDAAWHVRWRAQWPTRTLTGVVCAGFCAFPTAPIGPRPLLPAPICTRTPWSPDDHRARVAHPERGARRSGVDDYYTAGDGHVEYTTCVPRPIVTAAVFFVTAAAAVACRRRSAHTHTH